MTAWILYATEEQSTTRAAALGGRSAAPVVREVEAVILHILMPQIKTSIAVACFVIAEKPALWVQQNNTHTQPTTTKVLY